jgi:hypothetical protein
VPPELRFDLGRETRSCVGHGQQDPGHRELRVQLRLDEVDRPEQLREALECVVLGLDRDDRPVRSRECIDGQRAEGRRAVEQDVGVLVHRSLERVCEVALAAGSVREIDRRGGEIALRHDDVEVLDVRRLREGAKRGAVQQVVSRDAVRAHAETRRGVRLWVEVDHEDRSPASARQALRLTAVVVLPTPPFWFATA